MRIRNNALVCDTETVGTFGEPLVHNIGWQVLDKNFKVLATRHFLVQEVHLMKWAMNYNEFYRGKREAYENYGVIEMARWADIVKQFHKDCRNNRVSTICAYNIAFDYRALNYTSTVFNTPKFTELLDSKKMLCIWNMACESLLNTDKFREWATLNGKVSEKGNYQTSAEVAYQYIIENPQYEEWHIALPDVEIEVEILKHILQNYTNAIEYGLSYACWRKVQK